MVQGVLYSVLLPYGVEADDAPDCRLWLCDWLMNDLMINVAETWDRIDVLPQAPGPQAQAQAQAPA